MSKSTQDPAFELASYFPYLVRLFYRDVSSSVKDVYTTLFDLSVGEWRSMAVLNDFEPLSAKEIVARSSMDKVTVSRAISSLCGRNLLDRHVDPSDRRCVLLRLTRTGKQVMADLVPLVLDVERQLFEGLSENDQETLKTLMRKVGANARSIRPPFAHSRQQKRA